MNHLDVKPANIMVRSKDNTPILIDFGLSKQYDSEGNQTSTTPVGISHGYAPIEQYRDGGVREFSPQTDLYSLAATLYYILSGNVPPQASALVEDDLTFPLSFPQNLEGPIRKAMSSARKRRQETIDVFLKEIDCSIHLKSPVSNNYEDLKSEDTIVSLNSNNNFAGMEECNENYSSNDTDSDYQSQDYDFEEDDEIPFYKKRNFLIGVGVSFFLIICMFYWSGVFSSSNTIEKSNVVDSVDIEEVEYDVMNDSCDALLTPVIPVMEISSNESAKETSTIDKSDEIIRSDEQIVKEAVNSSDNVEKDDVKSPLQSAREVGSKVIEDEIFVAVDQQAEFPGGTSALMKWLVNNIHYPADAQQNDIQGRVLVQFVVEKNGSISNVKVVRRVDKSLDAEAMRVVRAMPRWTPGKNDGQPVRSYFNLPITFKLKSEN